MESFLLKRDSIEEEILKLKNEEARIDKELSDYFGIVIGTQNQLNNKTNSLKSSHLSFDDLDIASNIKKIENFGPSFEAMEQDSRKLISQIDDCQQLSDYLSSMVRRLDIMQINSQQALACTEDIINLKNCKTNIILAIEENNLSMAVNYLRQVKDINLTIAQSSDDYEVIKAKEMEVKIMVRKEFNKAIEECNIKAVMSLCPLLQTLSLESEARDTFLDFIEKSVFIAVSGDAASVDGATDPATGYAKSLTNVFNATYVIIQQYLPMVIQGMENSLGDIYFIRRLHLKCEKEAGLVLKRYMKYRNIREVISILKQANNSNSTTISNNNPNSNSKQPLSPAEIHTIMDELALLIQYCCRYAKYLKQICQSAESKIRIDIISNNNSNNKESAIVFAGPTEFDKMVDELINKYYMEGESYLMRLGVAQALPRSITPTEQQQPQQLQQIDSMHLDECFFMLQKCGLRSIATNNIHAACAVLHIISDLLCTDLLNQANAMLTSSTSQLVVILQDHITKFKKSITYSNNTTTNNDDDQSSMNGLSKSFQNAFLLGTSSNSESSIVSSGYGIKVHEEGGFSLIGIHNHYIDHDPWGVMSMIETFNIMELCIRYTDRLNKDITNAGNQVFATIDPMLLPSNNDPTTTTTSSLNKSKNITNNTSVINNNKGHGPNVMISNISSELDKLKLCKEDFESAKILFSNTFRQYVDKIIACNQLLMKDIFLATIGHQAPMGGVKFDEQDHNFDSQPALNLLPRLLCLPIETMVNICTFNLNEPYKDVMVGLLVDSCCDRLEQFINQTNFRFAGALKLEELIRTLIALFGRYSSIPIRGRFARIREIMLVLTSDPENFNIYSDNFTQLTSNEIEAFISLRIDKIQK